MNELAIPNRKKLSVATEAAIVFLVLHNIPYVGNHTPASVFGILVISMYGLLFYEARRGLYANTLMCISIIGVLILEFLTECFYANQILIKNAYGLLQVFIYPYLGLLFIKYDLGKTVSRLFWLILLSYFITAITTYSGCQIVPGASRILASSTMLADSGMQDMIINLNIAGFAEMYTMVLLTPLIVMMMRRKTLHFIIGIMVLVALGFAVIASEYTGALFVFVLSLFSFFLPKDYSQKKYLVTTIVLLVAGVFGYVLVSQLLAIIANQIDSSVVSERISDLSRVLSGGQGAIDANSDLLTRRDDYVKSLEAFLLHPFGVWDMTLTGGHSFVLDSLARFGMLGFVLLVIMYRQLYFGFIKCFRTSPDFGYCIIAFMLVFALALLNPDPNILFVCFIFPVFFRYSSSR